MISKEILSEMLVMFIVVLLGVLITSPLLLVGIFLYSQVGNVVAAIYVIFVIISLLYIGAKDGVKDE